MYLHSKLFWCKMQNQVYPYSMSSSQLKESPLAWICQTDSITRRRLSSYDLDWPKSRRVQKSRVLLTLWSIRWVIVAGSAKRGPMTWVASVRQQSQDWIGCWVRNNAWSAPCKLVTRVLYLNILQRVQWTIKHLPEKPLNYPGTYWVRNYFVSSPFCA